MNRQTEGRLYIDLMNAETRIGDYIGKQLTERLPTLSPRVGNNIVANTPPRFCLSPRATASSRESATGVALSLPAGLLRGTDSATEIDSYSARPGRLPLASLLFRPRQSGCTAQAWLVRCIVRRPLRCRKRCN